MSPVKERMKLSDKVFYTIMHYLPPTDKEVAVLKCRQCGKLRLLGEIHNPKTRACPKCNAQQVVVPQTFTFRNKVDYLWAALFKRKQLLFGIEEGAHDFYTGEVV